jgi:methylglutaconyl-CoA hydratase
MGEVAVRDEGPVRWIALDRPEKRNALDAAMVEALLGALEASRGSAARCIALTGAGAAFSAGADLAALRRMAEEPFERNLADAQRLADLFLAIAEHPLPVVAAVNGPALGGGAGLVAACDRAIGVDSAQLGFTEVRLGFVPAIVLNFLVRRVSGAAARDLCLTGRRIDANEAKALGLLDEVVPPGGLEAGVAAVGALFAECSPEAIARTKRLFVELPHLSLPQALRAAADANARARATDDCREGIAAFLERRPPRWRDSVPDGERGDSGKQEGHPPRGRPRP